MKRHHPWAEKGIEALALSLPETRIRGYCCPLCVKFFDSPEDLTVEHAPAQSVGGKAMAVTCRPCNSRSGHELEVHVAAARRMSDFAEGRSELDIAFEVHGRSVNATAAIRGDAISVVAAPKRTNPAAQAAFISEMQRLAVTKASPVKGSVVFRVGPLDARRERAAWLKAGFLIAFAAWGYRYALRPILNRIRAQIAEPDSPTLERAAFRDSNQGERGGRWLIIVRQPEDLRCVLVEIDDWRVMLPDFTPEPDFYERLSAAMIRRGTSATYTGDLMPWPEQPLYALDYQMAGMPLK